MTTITEKVKEACLKSDDSGRAIRSALMNLFRKIEITIVAWIKAGDIRLTTVDALEIIEHHTGLPRQEILCDTTAQTA
jgi:hypothetical protein